MVEHYTSVTVNAPIHQVYALFTHFNDFPKFMHFVNEVTYYDERRSHWVVLVRQHYEWDAVNEDWIPNQQIGWRSTNGLRNSGRVKFRPTSLEQTIVDVYIHYLPPRGPLGQLADTFGMNGYFSAALQEDLVHFARMAEAAPPGALDPMSSHYLFHPRCALSIGGITQRQKLSMANDPMMSPDALTERQRRLEQEAAIRQEALRQREALRKQQEERERKALRDYQVLVARESARKLQEKKLIEARATQTERTRELHPVHDTLGGRNASLDRTALGDQDARRARYPHHEQDPMISRLPVKRTSVTEPLQQDEKRESPWRSSIRGL